jgi:hypothetical protein
MANENTGGGDGKETVMDAINEALGLGGTGDEHVEHQNPADTSADDADDLLEAGDDQDASGDSDDADHEGEPGGGEADGDKPEGQAGAGVEPPKYPELVAEAAKLGIQQRNADGTIKSGQALAAEIAAKKGGEPGKESAAAAQAKKPDALNDPIPKDLKVETQQRIRTLIDRTKQSEEKAATAEQNFTFMVDGLKAVGATPEQYGETLSFLALFNSNDPKQQGHALDILEDMTDKLSTLLGRERKTNDPLAAHADLQAAVARRELTPKYAAEVARTRNQGAFRTELSSAAQNAQQQERQAQQDLDQARNDLNTLEQTLKNSDPLYARKRAAIVPVLKPIFSTIPPKQWKGAFEQAYRNVRVAQPRPSNAGATPPGGAPKNQPLRAGKNPAGSGANANGGSGMSNGGPQSMLEAVNAALARG